MKWWGERWGSNPRQPESQLGIFYLLINDLISSFVIISQKYALDSKEVSFYLSSEF